MLDALIPASDVYKDSGNLLEAAAKARVSLSFEFKFNV